MTEDEEILAYLMVEKGYVVLNLARRYHPGEPIEGLDHGEPFKDQPWYAIAETSREEADEQLAHFGEIPVDYEWAYPYFYRVSTD